MSREGFITISRKLLEWEWFHEPNTVHLFIYLLLKANYIEGKYEGELIERGCLVFGRKVASAETGLSEQNIRTGMDRLVKCGVITIKVTSRFSVVTISKYDSYQNMKKDNNQPFNQPINHQSTTQTTLFQPATNHESTTSKEKEEIEEKKELIPTELIFLQYCKELLGEKYESYEFALKAKYKAWVEAKWKDGNGSPIKIWKTKIQNTIPYLKPMFSSDKTGEERPKNKVV